MENQNNNSIIFEARSLLESGELSDITFVLGDDGVEIKAHRFILKMRSSVLAEKLSRRPITEAVTRIDIDEDPAIFKCFIHFLYTDELSSQLAPTDLMELLRLANLFCVPLLVEKISELLIAQINANNAILMYEGAQYHSAIELATRSFHYMLVNGEAVFCGNGVKNAKENTLLSLAAADTLQVKEITLFKALVEWALENCKKIGIMQVSHNLRTILKDFIHLIRFPIMDTEDFFNSVVPSRILNAQEVILIRANMLNDAVPIEFKNTPRVKLPFPRNLNAQ